jgi:hypothetical protein
MKGKHGGRYFLRGKTFWIAFYDGRGNEKRETARTADETKAKKLLEFRLRQVSKSLLDNTPFEAPKLRRMTMDDCLERFKTEYQLRGKWHDQNLSDWKVVKARFGAMSCDRITKELVQDYQLEQKQAAIAKRPARGKEKHPYSENGTINRRVWLLCRAMKVADLVPPKVQRLPEPPARQGFFESPDQVRRVLENLPPHIADAILCLHLTGWRLSEIIGRRVLRVYRPGLTWADKMGDTLRLPAERHKNRRAKKMPLTGKLAALIARRERAKVAGCDLIFCRPDGKPLGDIHRPWQRACKMAGCPGRLLHDLRRSRARSSIHAGVSERVAMELGGWQTRSIFDRYNIVSENDMRAAQEKTEVYLQNETEKQLKQTMTVQ